MTNYLEADLLSHIAEGSEYAFTRIFDHYQPRVFGIARYVLKSREMAEEVVQEVFLEVWLKRSELCGLERFDVWLFTVARNLTLDRLRKISYEATQSQSLQ